MIAFVFIGMGFGQITSGYITGRTLDKYPNTRVRNFVFGVVELASVVSFGAVIIQSYKMSLIAGFLWGMSDNETKTFCMSLISAKFKGNLEMFAVHRATQTVRVVLTAIIIILFSEMIGTTFVLLMLLMQIGRHYAFNLTYGNMEQNDKNKDTELLVRTPSSH